MLLMQKSALSSPVAPLLGVAPLHLDPAFVADLDFGDLVLEADHAIRQAGGHAEHQLVHAADRLEEGGLPLEVFRLVEAVVSRSANRAGF